MDDGTHTLVTVLMSPFVLSRAKDRTISRGVKSRYKWTVLEGIGALNTRIFDKIM